MKAEALSRHRAAGEAAEAREDWRGALAEYDAALKLDAADRVRAAGPRAQPAPGGAGRDTGGLPAAAGAPLRGGGGARGGGRPRSGAGGGARRPASPAADGHPGAAPPGGPNSGGRASPLRRLDGSLRPPRGDARSLPREEGGPPPRLLRRAGKAARLPRLSPDPRRLPQPYPARRWRCVAARRCDAHVPGGGGAATRAASSRPTSRSRSEDRTPTSRCPGLAGDEPAAFLALDDGELFAQPRGRVPPVDRRASRSPPRSGFATATRCASLGTRIRVGLAAPIEGRCTSSTCRSSRATEAPALVVPAAYERPAEGDALVHPADYRPRPLPLDARPRAVRRLPLRALALALIALLAAGFVFAARAVEVRVEPEPERLSVRGLPAPRVGTRCGCSCPATTPSAREREGYRPLEARLVVTTDRQPGRRASSWSVFPAACVSRRAPRAACASSSTARSAGRRRWRRWRSRPGTTRCRCARRDTQAFTTRLRVAGGGAEETLRATLVPDRAPVSFTSEPAERARARGRDGRWAGRRSPPTSARARAR